MKHFFQLFCLLLSALSLQAQVVKDINNLTIKARIDSVYVFGYDLTESRLAKGAIWNLQTGKAETPQSFTSFKADTIGGVPVMMLYREVVRGNHPLNGWETWIYKDGKWEAIKDINNDTEKEGSGR